MPSQLESEFHAAMINIYRRAKTEADYAATRFIAMVSDLGGLETARYLLRSSTVSDGYTALWERDRLDLTVEAVVLQAKWWPLFTRVERETAVGRLKTYEFKGELPQSLDLPVGESQAMRSNLRLQPAAPERCGIIRAIGRRG